MEIRDELIQVGAVAVAAVEDLDIKPDRLMIFSEVNDERKRQDAKWGEQHHHIDEWLLILMEEVGEIAEHVWHGQERQQPWSLKRDNMLFQMMHLGREAKAFLDGRDV